MVGVVDVGGLGYVAHHILADDGSRLVAKGIDACAVVHVLSVVVDEVGMYRIVLHAHQVAIPSPPQRDACIRDVVDGVVVDTDAADIAGGDGDAAPVFVGDVVEEAVGDLLSGAYVAEVGRLVRQVGLQTFGREGAHYKAVHGNVVELAVAYFSTFTSYYIVETRASEVLEMTPFKTDVLCMSDFYSRIGTTQPTLIVKLVVILAVNLRTQLIGLRQVHACLQGDVAFFRRAHPRSMTEGYTFYGDVAHRMICCADHLDKGLKNGISSKQDFHRSLLFTRIIIQFVLSDVMIPLSRTVEQRFGIGHIKR